MAQLACIIDKAVSRAHTCMSNCRVIVIFLLLLISMLVVPTSVWANQTDSSGGTAGATGSGAGYAYTVPVTVTGSGVVQSIGVNWASKPSGGNIEVALYSASSGRPANLLTSSSSVAVATGVGWQDIPVTSYSVVAGSYWLAFTFDTGQNSGQFYYSYGTRVYYGKNYGAFDATWSSSSGQDGYNYNLRITYSTNAFTATHASFSASSLGSTVQASLGFTNTLGQDVTVIFTVTDSSNNVVDTPSSTASNGVTGGTVSATSKSLNPATYHVSWKAYAVSDSSHSNPLDSSTLAEQQSVTTTGPSANDFMITASTPTSQTVSAGATATYTLNIQYGSSLSATVNFAVTSGCPTGSTCTVTPSSVTGTNTATLSVPTQLTTTGTLSITVTASATSPSLSHIVTVQLTVNGPSTFPVTVQAGATQVIVTVTSTGSGSTPVYLAGPGGTPLYPESSGVIYNRISNPTVVSAPTLIHRVTFTITPPSSAQTWTALVSLSLPGSYTVTVEVS